MILLKQGGYAMHIKKHNHKTQKVVLGNQSDSFKTQWPIV